MTRWRRPVRPERGRRGSTGHASHARPRRRSPPAGSGRNVPGRSRRPERRPAAHSATGDTPSHEPPAACAITVPSPAAGGRHDNRPRAPAGVADVRRRLGERRGLRRSRPCPTRWASRTPSGKPCTSRSCSSADHLSSQRNAARSGCTRGTCGLILSLGTRSPPRAPAGPLSPAFGLRHFGPSTSAQALRPEALSPEATPGRGNFGRGTSARCTRSEALGPWPPPLPPDRWQERWPSRSRSPMLGACARRPKDSKDR